MNLSIQATHDLARAVEVAIREKRRADYLLGDFFDGWHGPEEAPFPRDLNAVDAVAGDGAASGARPQ